MERFGGFSRRIIKRYCPLKGIGEYTAAAIRLLCWNQPCPVVDGNVYRVLSRLFAVDTPIDSTRRVKAIRGTGRNALGTLRTQGRIIRRSWNWVLCNVFLKTRTAGLPVKDKCMAFASGNVQAYPVKQNKTKTRDRYFHYLYIIYKGQTWMNRRAGKDIWTGLYEFPLIETDHAMDFSGLCETQAFP